MKSRKKIMVMLSRISGVLSVLAGCATVAIAQQPPGPNAPSPASSGDLYVVMALFTSALGAVGAWLSPIVREWMATRRYESQDHVFSRECWRWIRDARKHDPSLPLPPDPPHGWADDPDDSIVDVSPTMPHGKQVSDARETR